MAELSEASGLTESQVYKWAWDQKKKLQATTTGISQFMEPEEIKKLRRSGRKYADQAELVVDHENGLIKIDCDKIVLGQAEVTRDEFGGYCCKRWGNENKKPAEKNVKE